MKQCQYTIALLTILACTAMVGCCHRYVSIPLEVEKLPVRVEGSDEKVRRDVEKRLAKYGVQLIVLGQNHLISIPASLLFPKRSPQLKWPSYRVLNDVSCYLKQFRKVSIHVNAFTNKLDSTERDRAMTLQRARKVGYYLASQDIDSRFIFTDQQGSDKPIVSFSQKNSFAPNDRVEITFRDEVA